MTWVIALPSSDALDCSIREVWTIQNHHAYDQLERANECKLFRLEGPGIAM